MESKLAVGFNYSHYLNLTYLLALTSVPFRFKEFEPIFENNYFLIHTTTRWIGFNVFAEKWHRLPMSNLLFIWNLSPLQSSKFSFEYLLLPSSSRRLGHYKLSLFIYSKT
ncbi:hypothetical protein H8356DRAFT_1325199 [Neocallimastix lanati (nom. inval.)]|nr:hypothetical protein H8356DRAFT_1325199 [Neocallimastix sp. JGI-2020a]